MVPVAATRAIVAAELAGAVALASRHALSVDWDPDDLRLRVGGLRQPPPPNVTELLADDSFTLVGDFRDYRTLPPIWDFEDPATGELGTLAAFPLPVGAPVSSIFIHSNGRPIVCAPFSRKAYAEASGPHGDWGSSAGWLEVKGSVILATTIGEMINAFVLHLSWTRGRMGPPRP